MTTKENTRVVWQAYQNIKAGDVGAFVDLFDESVEWQLPEMANVPFAGTWQGPEEVRRFFGRIADLQDVVEFEPRDYVAQGDKVIVLGRFTMRIRSTAREFSSEWAHVWTLKDGKVTQFYEYVDTAVVSKAYTAAQTATKRG